MGPLEIALTGGLVVLLLAGVLVLARGRRAPRSPSVSLDVAQRVASATAASEFTRILVPTLGGVVSDRMVLLACKLARPYEAQVEVLYVVEVPMAMPASAELPEEMAKASDALTEAELIGRANGVPVRSRVEKGRFAGKVIVDTAKGVGAELIILGAPARKRHGEWGRTVEYVFRNAACDVIIERAARDRVEQT